MDPFTSSFGVIPPKKLKLWAIFCNVGDFGEEILKTAKLAHVINEEEGFIVTMTDETYSFIYENPGPGGYKISKIRELSGIRVKEFLPGQEVDFALTEDGRLFSWLSELDRFGEGYVDRDQDIVNQLGRYVDCRTADKMTLFRRPAPVTEGSLTGVKVRQVAVSGWKRAYTMALSVAGDVHQWGSTRSWGPPISVSWTPILIPKEHFGHQEVISVACSNHMGVALTAKGELFQWKLADKMPQKVVIEGSALFKKITGSWDLIFALTVKGQLYCFSTAVDVSSGLRVRKTEKLFEDQKIEDVASSIRTENVVVVELKNNTRFAISYCEEYGGEPPHIPWFTFPSDASMDELFAKYGVTCHRTISARIEPPPRRRASHTTGDLWEDKKHADVTFSVEGKLITAHKCILAKRSEYFERMFSNEWNEAKGGSSSIEVKDTKHDTFKAILFYFYCDKIKFEEDEYENIFDLMKLADYYCEETIRHECEKILINNINPENAFFLARNASSANALTLEEKVIKFIVDNQLLVDHSSPQEMVGMEAFQKISVALLRQ